jgi:hypothetical protein
MTEVLKISVLFGFLGGYTIGLYLGIWTYFTLWVR